MCSDIFKMQHKYSEYRFKRCTLSLNSPSKANWFSGFPSGTLYLLNQSKVASRYPGLSRLTSSISATNQQQRRPEAIQNNWWHLFQQRQQLLLQVIRTVIVGGFGVLSIDHDDLPVCFTLINQSQSSQHLHFDYFSSRAHLRSGDTFFWKKLRAVKFKRLLRAPSQRRSSTLFPMSHISMGSLSPQHPVSPSLWLGSSHVCVKRKHTLDGAEAWSGFPLCECRLRGTCLWNSSIVPDIAFVREHVRYITKIPLLHILFQWIERIFGGNLTHRWPKHSILAQTLQAGYFIIISLSDSVMITYH